MTKLAILPKILLVTCLTVPIGIVLYAAADLSFPEVIGVSAGNVLLLYYIVQLKGRLQWLALTAIALLGMLAGWMILGARLRDGPPIGIPVYERPDDLCCLREEAIVLYVGAEIPHGWVACSDDRDGPHLDDLFITKRVAGDGLIRSQLLASELTYYQLVNGNGRAFTPLRIRFLRRAR